MTWIQKRIWSTWKLELSMGATNRLYYREMEIYHKKELWLLILTFITIIETNLPLIFISKNCLITIILVWQQSICYQGLVTYNVYMWFFQYKILNNAVFLNKNFIFLEWSHLHFFISLIYTVKYFLTHFMNVTVLNAYGRT